MLSIKKILSILLCLLPAHNLLSQSDSIITFRDLEFNSEFEKKSFISIREGKKDYFRLFAAIDPDVNEKIFSEFRRDIGNSCNKINTRKFSRLKKEKKIRQIYQHVNENILYRYQDKILFPHLFVNGTFNCLTASAYYGFLMDSLGIPYEFRESTDHVLPVAYPDELQIKIETTNRISGIQYYDDKLKNRFVNYLLENGIITKEQYYRNSAEEIFHYYFFPESAIQMKELAGLHYMNDALYKFNVSRFHDAFIQIKKAYYLYPSERMMTLLQFILAGRIISTDFQSMEDADFFILLSRFPENRLDSETIENLFVYMSDMVLFNRGDKDFYDEFYESINMQLKPGDLKNRIDFQYNLLRGKSLVADFKFREGLELLENAVRIRPGNIEVQTMLISAFAYTFLNAPGIEMMEQLEAYGNEFPELLENGIYNSLKMEGYLRLAQQNFDLNKPAEGLRNLDKFEKLYEQYPSVEIDHSSLASAYSSAAVFYFKRYKKDKAIYFLKKGLEYSPDNFELKYRLRSI